MTQSKEDLLQSDDDSYKESMKRLKVLLSELKSEGYKINGVLQALKIATVELEAGMFLGMQYLIARAEKKQ